MHRFCRFALVCLPALLVGCGGDDDYTPPTDDVAGPPSLTSVTMSDSAAGASEVAGNIAGCTASVMHPNRMITVQLEASEIILPPSVLIGGEVATSLEGSGRSWTASRVLRPGDLAGPVSVRVIYRDRVGNVGEEATATTDGSSYTWNNPDQYRMCWADEFDGTAPDAENWTVQTGAGSDGESQTYAPSQVEVKDGKLVIAVEDGASLGEYLSGRIHTRGKVDFNSSLKVEIRAKLPAGQGVRPVIGMLPAREDLPATKQERDDNAGGYGPWPQSGGIDIVQAVNLGTGMPARTAIASSVHYGFAAPAGSHSTQQHAPAADPSADFHTYTLEWERFGGSGEMHFYFDGVRYATHSSSNWFGVKLKQRENEDGSLAILDGSYEQAGGAAPFDRAFYLLLDVVVGGDRPGISVPGAPDATTSLPKTTLEVDWIRVSECVFSDRELGCATDRSAQLETASGTGGAELHTLNLYRGVDALPLRFDVQGSPYTNTLTVAHSPPGSSVVTVNDRNADDPDPAGNPAVPKKADGTPAEENPVWRLTIAGGVGNAYIASADSEALAANEALAPGFDLRGLREAGALVFDMHIAEISDGTSLAVKMASGGAGQGQMVLTELAEPGKWQTYNVPIRDLLANPAGAGLDLANVVNLFVMEATHATVSATMADLYLDNIHLVAGCPTGDNCAPRNLLEPVDGEFLVYRDTLPESWGSFSAFDEALGYNSCVADRGDGCPSINWAQVAVGGRGHVVQVTYPGNAKFAGLVVGGPLASPWDLRAHAGGTLQFDVRHLPHPGDTEVTELSLTAKVDCAGCPVGAGQRERPLGDFATALDKDGNLIPGPWTSVTIAIDDLVNANGGPTLGGLQLDKVTTGLVIFPPSGMTAGESFQLDNVRWSTTPPPSVHHALAFYEGMEASALTFTVSGTAYTNTLQVDTYSSSEATVTSELDATDPADPQNSAWRLQITGGAGNAWINADVQGHAVLGDNLDLSALRLANGTIVGELVFDMYIMTLSDGTSLMVKMDSNFPNLGQVPLTGLAPPGEWKTYRVPVSDLVANPNAGGLDLANVNNPFVIEPVNAAPTAIMMDIYLDNIRLEVSCIVSANCEPKNRLLLPPHILTIYEGMEASALTFTVDGTAHTNPLRRGRWPDDNVVSMNNANAADPADVQNSVWQLRIAGAAGNAFIGSADLSLHPVLDSGLDLSGLRLDDDTVVGELVFDMRIVMLSDDTSLLVKMDSMWPHLGQVTLTSADLAPVGEWKTYRIKVSDLIDNPFTGNDGKGLDLANVNNVFVIEPTHATAGSTFMAEFYLDNIRLEVVCLEGEDCEPRNRRHIIRIVFDDAVNEEWGTLKLTAFDPGVTSGRPASGCHIDMGARCPSLDWALKDATGDDAARGKVLEVTYAADPADAWMIIGELSQNISLDFSAFAGGVLKFDLKVTANPSDSNLRMRLNCARCTFDLGARVQDLGLPTLDVWRTYSVNADDMVADGLVLDKLQTGLMLFWEPGKAGGIKYQLDNVRWETAPTHTHTLTFFEDGDVKALTFTEAGADHTDTLQAGIWPDDKVVSTHNLNDIDPADLYASVWHLRIAGGLGNASIGTQDLRKHETLDWGLDLSALTLADDATVVGELVFDMYLEALSAGTSIVVKMDSGHPHQGVVTVKDLAPLGEWKTYRIAVSELLATPNPDGAGLDLARVLTPFVIEPANSTATAITAELYLNNIRLEVSCDDSEDCAPRHRLQPARATGVSAVYVTMANTVDEVDAQWGTYKLGAFDEAISWRTCTDDGGAGCPSVEFLHVDATEAVRGKVLYVEYASDAKFAGMVVGRDDNGLDFSAFAGGTLQFDLMVDTNPMSANFRMKVDCYGCPDNAGQREQSLGMPALNTWTSYTIAVDDMVNANDGPAAGGLQLDRVTTGLVIFPEYGKTAGVIFQLDNVRWVQAADTGDAPTHTLDFLQAGSATTLTFAAGRGAAMNTLVVGHWPSGTGTVTTNAPNTEDPNDSANDIWHLRIEGAVGNAFLTSQRLDLSGLRVASDMVVGELVFDLYVEELSAGTSLRVKMDSGYPHLGQVVLTDPTPPVGEWQTYRIAVQDFLDNPLTADGGTGLNLADVLNPFVIEAFHASDATAIVAEFYLNNIRLEAVCPTGANCDPRNLAPAPTTGGGGGDAPTHTLPIYYGMGAPSALTFTVDGTAHTNTLRVGIWPDSTVVSMHNLNAMDPADAQNSVWQLRIAGKVGNAYIGSADLSEHAVLDSGLDLSYLTLADDTTVVGELVFDMYLVTRSSSTNLVVKMDSGWPDLGMVTLSDDLADIGEWKTYRVAVSDLLANPFTGNNGTGLDLDNVNNLFVIETADATASAISVEFYLDNIRLEISCAESEDCAPRNRLQPAQPEEFTGVVFDDEVQGTWSHAKLSAYDEARDEPWTSCTDDGGMGCPSVSWETVDASDMTRGKVLEVTYAAAGTAKNAGMIIGLHPNGRDFSAFSGGTVQFDLLLIGNPGGGNFRMKVDCVFADPVCGFNAGQRLQDIGTVALTTWTTITVNVDDLVSANGGPTAGGLVLEKVTTGLVLVPPENKTGGIKYQLDNVRWVLQPRQ